MGGCCDTKFNRLSLLLLSVLIWVFAVVSVGDCSFWKALRNSPEEFGVGLFNYEVDGSCQSFPSEMELTATYKMARAFGILATILTAFAMIGISLVLFALKKGQGAAVAWTTTKVCYGLAIPCTLAMFASVDECIDEDNQYGDEYICELGVAGFLAGANVFLLLGVSIAACCTPLPAQPLCADASCCDEEENVHMAVGKHSDPYVGSSSKHRVENPVTRSVTVTAEGRTITQVTRCPGGSEVITETFEPSEGV